ncbi:ABC transporter substrate-binding protein [uncultured Bartonella sp.]|uniref:ABC transporter substrate-binding protein n=1 Tax=uncultured Bartonella sp. TaxID=104108 RepID=UPI0025EAB2A0|nr:ABC transporter substrate-binding protein [uncultured Bartonella sp.]
MSLFGNNFGVRALLIAVSLTFTQASWSESVPLDLSVEQPGRPHTTLSQERANEVANVPFVKKDTLTIAFSTNSSLPLHDYASDAKTWIGSDADLVSAIAERMGKKLEIININWADWPLGLSSGKYDGVIANLTVTEERKEKFDFATYRHDIIGIYVKKSSSIKEIKEAKDIAGLRVITDAGTNQEKLLLQWNDENVKNGLKPVEVQYYDDRALQTLALDSDRADAIFSVNAMQSLVAATTGKTRLVGTVNGGWPLTADIAVGLPKNSPLTKPVADCINDLIADGTYEKILKRWNLWEEGISQSQINPPGLPKPQAK